MEGVSSRVCVPAFRPSGCTQSIHEDHETGCCPPTTDWHSADYLLGRPSFHELVQGRSSTGHDYSAVLARESGLRNKPREILLSTDTTVGVCQVRCEYSGYDSAPARLQGGGDQIPLFQDVIASRSFSTGALSAHRQTNCVYSSYFPSSLALSAPAESETALARFGHFDATTALSTEAKDELQWWLGHLSAWNGRALLRPSPDAMIETDASRTGWGAVWSQMEKKLHINCFELLAGSFAVQSFTKDRLCVHVRLRMDNVSAVGPCALDLFANRLNAQLTLFYSWRPDPMALATDAFLQNWAVGTLYAFPPPLLSYNALCGEAQRGRRRTHTGDSYVANTGLVSESSGIVGLPSDSLTLGSQGSRRVNHTRW